MVSYTELTLVLAEVNHWANNMQMYCSNVGWWVSRADATESYVQGPWTGKRCKLKVQIFAAVQFTGIKSTQGKLHYGQSFLIFPQAAI